MKKSFILMAFFSIFVQKNYAQLLYGCEWAENCAWQIGASFADANQDCGKEDVRRFCADEYPILDINGRYEEEMSLQTACILGGSERLEEIENENQ